MIYIKTHALKRACRRFHLDDGDAARAFLLEHYEAASDRYQPGDGSTLHVCGDVVIATRPARDGEDGISIVTCFRFNAKWHESKERYRRAWHDFQAREKMRKPLKARIVA